MTLDTNLSLNGDKDIGNTNMDLIDFIPTSNAGGADFVIEEGIKYGGTLGKYNITGNVLLNQCGTLLSRKTSNKWK